jgi:hypothetical protein
VLMYVLSSAAAKGKRVCNTEPGDTTELELSLEAAAADCWVLGASKGARTSAASFFKEALNINPTHTQIHDQRAEMGGGTPTAHQNTRTASHHDSLHAVH